jgi:uncharacterized protein YndB with AHSA1/START domain
MNNKTIVIERTFNAPVSKVWKAITDKDEMKNWYFNLEEFKPVVGFTFQFSGDATPGVQYQHLCGVTEVIAEKKLTYSWRYDGYPGNSYVSFELFEQGEKTLVRLKQEGVDSFAAAGPDFAKKQFCGRLDLFCTQCFKRIFGTIG